MYRGIIELDANGQAVVSLPDYFDEVNINPSYQLTPIGTGTQPYVASEISGNKFTVAGAPGTKVSWTVHAQRNDAVIRYFSSKIENYTSDVRNKRPSEVGKYYLPEAYSADKTKGILYNEGRDKNYREKDAFVKQQKANSSPEAKSAPYQNVKNVSDSKEKEEMSSPVRSNTDDDKLSNR